MEDWEQAKRYLNRESTESILRQIRSGEIELTPRGVVNKRVNTFSESVNTFESDPDGEWVREMAHVLNMDAKTFKKKIEQNIYR